VLVLLPPSETKAAGGDCLPLTLERLSFPELNAVRCRIADLLVLLAGNVPASVAALGLSVRQESEVGRNAELWATPTLPALVRYTGVLYDALDTRSMGTVEWERARERLVVSSALFGIVRAADPIPRYRLSAGATLPGVGALWRLWRPVIEPMLAGRGELVLDLRSGPYVNLARVPNAITVRVVTEDSGGRRKAVSHFNKAHKGRLARALVDVPAEPCSIPEVIAAAAAAGLRLDQTGELSVDLLA
jgi:cytoplasmic iron level regulating protein YaaA (DUF328/UPF0246 family)